tara:strand:+ start:322 stop:645 length:324 start_codon:yes stop_codon:yes gene_type:complete
MGFEWSVGYAVDPHKFGRNALSHFGVVMRLSEDRQPGVRVKIDESWAHDSTFGVNCADGFQVGNVASVDSHLFARHAYGAIKSGAAAAVDNESVSYEQVEQLALLSS